MKDLIIIGAGNVGGFLALNQKLFDNQYNIIGFLDDDINKIGKELWNIPVLGRIDDIYTRLLHFTLFFQCVSKW